MRGLVESIRTTNRTSLPAAALVATLAALAVLAAPVAAQQRPPVSIAVIDVGRILEDSKAGQAAVEKLVKLRDTKGAEGEVMQTAAQDLQDRIKEGQMTLSEEKLEELRVAFEDKVQELRAFQERANRELQREQEKALGEIEKKVMPVIRQVGQEFGYTVIFNKFQSGLVYADEAIDITDLVLERFDASAPEG